MWRDNDVPAAQDDRRRDEQLEEVLEEARAHQPHLTRVGNENRAPPRDHGAKQPRQAVQRTAPGDDVIGPDSCGLYPAVVVVRREHAATVCRFRPAQRCAPYEEVTEVILLPRNADEHAMAHAPTLARCRILGRSPCRGFACIGEADLVGPEHPTTLDCTPFRLPAVEWHEVRRLSAHRELCRAQSISEGGRNADVCQISHSDDDPQRSLTKSVRHAKIGR